MLPRKILCERRTPATRVWSLGLFLQKRPTRPTRLGLMSSPLCNSSVDNHIKVSCVRPFEWAVILIRILGNCRGIRHARKQMKTVKPQQCQQVDIHPTRSPVTLEDDPLSFLGRGIRIKFPKHDRHVLCEFHFVHSPLLICSYGAA
jgi:hypothetical protein